MIANNSLLNTFLMEEKTCKMKCDGHKNTLKVLDNNGQ